MTNQEAVLHRTSGDHSVSQFCKPHNGILSQDPGFQAELSPSWQESRSRARPSSSGLHVHVLRLHREVRAEPAGLCHQQKVMPMALVASLTWGSGLGAHRVTVRGPRMCT